MNSATLQYMQGAAHYKLKHALNIFLSVLHDLDVLTCRLMIMQSYKSLYELSFIQNYSSTSDCLGAHAYLELVRQNIPMPSDLVEVIIEPGPIESGIVSLSFICVGP